MTQSMVVSWPGSAVDGPVFFETPGNALDDIPALIAWCKFMADEDTEISVVITSDAEACLDLPEKPDAAGEALDVPGWEHGPAGPWITYRRNGIRVHLGFWSWMVLRPRDHALFFPILTDPHTAHHPTGPILCQLDGWRMYTGIPYRGIPGIAGTSLLRSLAAHKKTKEPLWHHAAPIVAHEPEIGSWRSPAASETIAAFRDPDRAAFPHSYDANRAYLAAAGCAEVCIDRLTNTGPIPFDPSKAGWWLIDTDPWCLPDLMPDPVYQRMGPRRPGQTVTWVTTPTAKLLHDLSGEGNGVPGFTVHDSWTGKGTRLFRGWAGCLNNYAMELIDRRPVSYLGDAQLQCVKDAYRQAVGLMNHEGGAVWRPDWHYTIIAQARATLWRKLWAIGHTTGRWPVAISTDAVTYDGIHPDNEASENPGLPIGNRLGEWKIKKDVRIR